MGVNKFNIPIYNAINSPTLGTNNYVWNFDRNILPLNKIKYYSGFPDKIYSRVLFEGNIFGIILRINEKK
jgi:hypothetical protein